jgi:hypothetical protein
MSKLQWQTNWQTPALTEVRLCFYGLLARILALSLTHRELQDLLLFISMAEDHWPSFVVVPPRLPGEEGTQRPFQDLTVHARHLRAAFRAVSFHDDLHTLLICHTQNLYEEKNWLRRIALSAARHRKKEVNWLRWRAVREAHSEGRSWKDAREAASKRLRTRPPLASQAL